MPAKKYATDEERIAARKAQRRAWFEANRALEDERRRARRLAEGGRNKDRAYSAAYNAAHRERLRLKARERYAADSEAILARQRAARAADPEPARERTRAWKRDNPGAQRLYEAKRAGIKVEGDLTPQEWREILEEFAYRCGYCGAAGKMEQEHMTPLSRGGQHTRSNVIPACRSCNASKGSRTMLEFLSVSA